MNRYFAEIAFDGTHYHGWQIQPNAITVQAVINDALQKILRDPSINVMGCGRTDTGVHAHQFYLHFETNKVFEDEHRIRINGFTPKDIFVFRVFEANNMHARFDATSRTYKYYILNKPNVFKQHYAWPLYKPLDIDLMNKEAQSLLGEHDFTSFSKAKTQTKTNNCLVSEAHWEKEEDFLVFTISANRFLRNMVRAIVGTLVDFGMGVNKEIRIEDVLQKKNRSAAGQSVPAQGLFLHQIEYVFNNK